MGSGCRAPELPPLVECAPLKTKLLERACVARWKRAQIPRADDPFRDPSFEVCRFCVVGAARVGCAPVERPAPTANVPKPPTLVERRRAVIVDFVKGAGVVRPRDVYRHLLDHDELGRITESITRKELHGLKVEGRLLRDGFATYRHPSAPHNSNRPAQIR